jgi:hypothetical protein
MAQGWAKVTWANGKIARAAAAPTMMPRVRAPKAKPATNSPGESGGVRKSPIRPFIFACSNEDDEFEKALVRICIMISPGAMKAPYATPSICLEPPTATTNTIM